MMSRSPKAHSKMLEEKIKSIFFYNFVLKANMIAQTNKNKQCSKGLKKIALIFCLVGETAQSFLDGF